MKITKINNRNLSFAEKIYLSEIVKGMIVTARHFFANLFHPSRIITVQYPEKKIPLSEAARFRTRHRLKKRKNGDAKCVACYMCQTACPADCIDIEAGEKEESIAEKYPVKFEIDLSRCVMCGFCVEACPEDAIAMDTLIIPGGAESRQELKLSLESLLLDSAETSERGAVNRRISAMSMQNAERKLKNAK